MAIAMIAVTISSLSNKMKILFILFTISAPLSAEWLPDVKILQSASAYTAHLIDRALQSGFPMFTPNQGIVPTSAPSKGTYGAAVLVYRPLCNE